jgi:hypothetical protein
MSTSYSAQIIYGIRLREADLVKSRPNPEYNPHQPYSAKTGKLISKTLDKEYDAEELAIKFKLDTTSTDDYVFFGKYLTPEIDLNYDERSAEAELPEQNQVELIKKIRHLLIYAGLEGGDIQLSIWLVTAIW